MKIVFDILKMLALVFLQNASFTLVSRARNSASVKYHAFAAVLSNGIWLLVIRQVVLNLDKWYLMVAYLVGSVCGSVFMHKFAMKFFENGKDFNYYLGKIPFIKKFIKPSPFKLKMVDK